MKRTTMTWMLLVAGGSTASAQTVTRGPYLQTPTAGSVIVRWRTDVPTSSRVAYGAAPGSLTSNADDGALTTEHIVPVGGLAADTQYYYSVGSVGGALIGDDVDHYFSTAPTTGTDRAMRIWVTGDGGFANANGFAVRDAYTTFNAGNPTDLWMLLGDNAYNIGTDAEYQASVFNMHHDLLRATPAWPVFGNHEAASSNSATLAGPFFQMFSLPTAGEAGGVASGTEAYYSFDWGNVHFIVLDSEQAHPTTAGAAILTWLTSDLQATTADWVIAMWHRPPYSKGLLHDSDVELNEIQMRQFVLPILEDYGVDLVLCGHSHNYERSYLLDGHYGLSGTFTSANQRDPGDGDPSGDGAYRKATEGPSPHEGAVYVVAGSSSDLRPATLNHPAHVANILELGSLVLDINGDTLTGRFLNSAVAITDSFQIVKGGGCPAAPRSGCNAGAQGRLVLRNNLVDAKDKLLWKWKLGNLDPADVGTPQDQSDLSVCVYDGTGALVGGDLPKGSLWAPSGGTGLLYNDPTLATLGMQRIRLKPSTGPKAQILVKAKGANLAMPPLPVTGSLTAQLTNLDNGICWENAFATIRKNTSGAVVATTP